MQVHGTGNVHGAHRIDPAHASQPTEQPNASTGVTGSDEVSISPEAELLSRINDIPDIRQERVEQIRAEIANGAYETEEKLDIAVSRLLDEIA